MHNLPSKDTAAEARIDVLVEGHRRHSKSLHENFERLRLEVERLRAIAVVPEQFNAAMHALEKAQAEALEGVAYNRDVEVIRTTLDDLRAAVKTNAAHSKELVREVNRQVALLQSVPPVTVESIGAVTRGHLKELILAMAEETQTEINRIDARAMETVQTIRDLRGHCQIAVYVLSVSILAFGFVAWFK